MEVVSDAMNLGVVSAVSTFEKCVTHGGGVKCNENGCNKLSQRKTNKCISHGGGIRCNENGCNKSAIGKTYKCFAHGGGLRCTVYGCNRSARSKHGKCKTHGGGVRCPNCIDWIDSRCGTSKYDGYCATCFKRVFPEDLVLPSFMNIQKKSAYVMQ